MTPAEIEFLIEDLDDDGNGEICYRWVLVDNSLTILTYERVLILFQEYGIPLHAEEIEALLDELDKDGDGEINYR